MININRQLNTAKQKAEFIDECEKSIEAQLDNVCEKLISNGAKIIALSGPTCSGKTTTAKKLTDEFTSRGYNVHFISIDDFFLERDVLDQTAIISGKSVDYDSIKAIDLELLEERVKSIIKGDPTELPVYDFTLGRCSHFRTLDPDDHSVFIFEGIQAIYPEVTALFGENYSSVYISVEDDIEINDVFFGKRDIRLMRRLLRDYKFRGAKPEFTFMLWRTVTQNEDRSIFPYVDTVDIRINSLMPYEFCLLKNELIPILGLISRESIFYPKALEITEKLNKLPSITADMVPQTSLMREFIG